MDLKWDYQKKGIKVLMRVYTQKVLKEDGHEPPKKPVYGPTKYEHLECGKQIQ